MAGGWQWTSLGHIAVAFLGEESGWSTREQGGRMEQSVVDFVG